MADKQRRVMTEFKKQLNTLIISAFGFVAALAWNDAIQSLVSAYIPSENAWPYLILNAVIITLIAVTITMFFSKKSK